jgi:hypothetical protein
MAENSERGMSARLPASDAIVAEKPFVPNRPMSEATDAASAPTYRILRTVEVDEYDPPISPGDVQPFGEALAGANQNFRGTSRKAAKLSISGAAVEAFNDVAALIDTLPNHQSMLDHDPEISTSAQSGRIESEERNVRVAAFLYAASREDDNDYHLIVGRDPMLDPVYMTMEVSGLPPTTSQHFERLDDARRSYSSFFGIDLPGTSYDFYDPPIPIEVEGSLFFDMSHANGSRPGPQSLRDDIPVVWEIHPISGIRFEP